MTCTRHLLPSLLAGALSAAGCSALEPTPNDADCAGGKCDIVQADELRDLLADQGVAALPAPAAQDKAVVDLGQLLFFDKLLSGNRDIACATCHHPAFGSSDALVMPVGVGGTGLGADRELGEGRGFIPRNSPDLFNRGLDGWETMFWDGRVSGKAYDDLTTPAADLLPTTVNDALAAQAMFPPTSADEMRGGPEDSANGNELAELAGTDFSAIWAGLAARLQANEDYVDRFYAAFPGQDIDFGLAATAIAAFEREAFASSGSPFDHYLAGDDYALTAAQKRGALLFFGEAGCSSCHSGPFLSDQQFHNICAPQLGPGKGDEAPSDHGRGRETKDDADKYAFRTPPLRNVALTGPWMHSGAYTTLEGAVRHHLDPQAALRNYDVTQVPEALQGTLQTGPDVFEDMAAGLDPLLGAPIDLSDADVADLVAFLEALTDPAFVDAGHLVPESVPSGLPVDR